LKRRFVATIECDRLLPLAGFFPQIAHTLDIATRHGSGLRGTRLARVRRGI